MLVDVQVTISAPRAAVWTAMTDFAHVAGIIACITEGTDGLTVTSVHDSRPQTLATRLMSIPMRRFFTGVARKALRQDLLDLKAAVERA